MKDSERREGGELPMVDVTEAFLTMTPEDFLFYMSKQEKDKYIEMKFSQLNADKQEQLESLLRRGWLKTVGIYATGEEVKNNPKFFTLERIETFPMD